MFSSTSTNLGSAVKTRQKESSGPVWSHQLNLSGAEKNALAAKNESLAIFFSTKTRKEGVPFRSIETETGSWQGVLFKFLQNDLSALKTDYPCLVRNSEEVLQFFLDSKIMYNHLYGFSIDVVELLYSIPQLELLLAVIDWIIRASSVSEPGRLNYCKLFFFFMFTESPGHGPKRRFCAIVRPIRKHWNWAFLSAAFAVSSRSLWATNYRQREESGRSLERCRLSLGGHSVCGWKSGIRLMTNKACFPVVITLRHESRFSRCAQAAVRLTNWLDVDPYSFTKI